MNDEEVLEAALTIARDMVDGSVPPRKGSADIWLLTAENDHACFEELAPFVAVASQWDELPEYQSEMAEDAIRAARELLAAHSGSSGQSS